MAVAHIAQIAPTLPNNPQFDRPCGTHAFQNLVHLFLSIVFDSEHLPLLDLWRVTQYLHLMLFKAKTGVFSLILPYF